LPSTELTSKRPNILWIVTTQWRAQALGYAGDPNARTPRLDALAYSSFNYTQAVTPHPFGPFARAALLTGVRSPENGVRDYFDPLPTEARTIAHDLNERGYETAFFGKWHLWERDPQAPLVGDEHAKIVVPLKARGGFQFWEGFESGFLLNDPWLHGTRFPDAERFLGYQSDVLCVRAVEWCKGPRAELKPWFCLVSLEAPHPPYAAPAAGFVVDPASLVLPANVPRGGPVEEKARRELAGYYAHIQATDRAIGRLLDELPNDDTLVVFTSVHGDMHGAHGLFRKGWPYEESVRIPLLIRCPGERARVVEDPISLLDLSALTLSYVDRGQLATPSAETAAISMPSVVALPNQCDRVWRGTRSKKEKTIWNADGSLWMRFDLERDPGEEGRKAENTEFKNPESRIQT